jgi:hypothetical protein
LFTGYEGDPIEPFSPIVQIQSPFITNPIPIFSTQ